MTDLTKSYLLRLKPDQHERLLAYARARGTDGASLLRDFIDGLDDAPETWLEAIGAVKH